MSTVDAQSDVEPGHGGRKVLVIDDSATIRQAATLLLKENNYDVVVAEDGFSGLSACAEHKPDIALIDVMMPRIDGFQACALIRNSEEFNQLPIIMLTSKDSEFDKAKAKLVGANEYVTKPFDREEFLSAIARAMETEQ